jgi:hypothetical protein
MKDQTKNSTRRAVLATAITLSSFVPMDLLRANPVGTQVAEQQSSMATSQQPTSTQEQKPSKQAPSTADRLKEIDELKEYLQNYKDVTKKGFENRIGELKSIQQLLTRGKENQDYMAALKWRLEYEKKLRAVYEKEIGVMAELCEQLEGKKQIVDTIKAYVEAHERIFIEVDTAQDRLEQLLNESQKRVKSTDLDLTNSPYWSYTSEYNKDNARSNFEGFKASANNPISAQKEQQFAHVLRDMGDYTKSKMENDDELFKYFSHSFVYFSRVYANNADTAKVGDLIVGYYDWVQDYEKAKLQKINEGIER